MPMTERDFIERGRICRFTDLTGEEAAAQYFPNGSGPGPRAPYLHVRRWADIDNPKAGMRPIMAEHEARSFFASLPDPRYFEEERP